MWVDSAALRAELRRLQRELEEELDESEKLLMSQAFISGEITAYYKIERMLDELEKVYRERESECVRGMKEDGNEKSRKIQRRNH